MGEGEMTERERTQALIALGAGMVATILLAAALPHLELSSGQIGWWDNGGELSRSGPGRVPGHTVIVTVGLLLFAWAQLLLPIVLIYLAFSRRGRREMLWRSLSLLWLVAFYFLLRAEEGLLERLGNISLFSPSSSTGGLEPPSSLIPILPTGLVHPPLWLTSGVAILFALALAASLTGAGYLALRFHRRSPDRPPGELAQKAQDALRSLYAGEDLRDTILRCYCEMIRLAEERRGLRRGAEMTPREFEQYLQAEGLPGEPVRRLTRLFEQVRYGAKITGEEEQQEAIACLRAIVEACGEP